MKQKLTSMAVKDSEEGDAVVEISVGNVRVLHRAAPTLHTHCHVSDLNNTFQ